MISLSCPEKVQLKNCLLLMESLRLKLTLGPTKALIECLANVDKAKEKERPLAIKMIE